MPNDVLLLFDSALSVVVVEGVKTNDMIESTELRIGNLLEYFIGTEGIGWEPTAIDWQDISSCADNNKQFNACHRPIDITEAALINFGFKLVHEKNKHYFINDPNGFKDVYKIHIFPTVNNQWHIAFSDIIPGKEQVYIPTTKIRHIHQLQNLFYALTNQELIKQ